VIKGRQAFKERTWCEEMKQAASHSRLQSGNESTIKALFRRTFSPSTALGNAVIGFRLVGKVGIDMNATKESFAEITTRFEKLDAAAAAMSLSLLKILVYVAVSSEKTRQRAIDACLAANVLSVPPSEMAAEVRRVIAKVMDEKMKLSPNISTIRT
jgi:hypothetical protein